MCHSPYRVGENLHGQEEQKTFMRHFKCTRKRQSTQQSTGNTSTAFLLSLIFSLRISLGDLNASTPPRGLNRGRRARTGGRRAGEPMPARNLPLPLLPYVVLFRRLALRRQAGKGRWEGGGEKGPGTRRSKEEEERIRKGGKEEEEEEATSFSLFFSSASATFASSSVSKLACLPCLLTDLPYTQSSADASLNVCRRRKRTKMWLAKIKKQLCIEPAVIADHSAKCGKTKGSFAALYTFTAGEGTRGTMFQKRIVFIN